MRSREIIWGDWNAAHITKHGGTVEMAEALIADPATRWAPHAAIYAKGLGTLSGRGWTLIVSYDSASVYPITMYPTSRGKRRR